MSDKCIYHPNAANQTFLVSDDHDLSTTEMVKLMAKVQGVKPWLVPVPVWMLKFLGKITGKSDMNSRLTDSLQVDITHTKETLDWTPPYSQFHQNSLTLTDGLGLNRVVTLLDQRLRFDGVNIVLRRATHDDMQQVYQWQCLPQTRQYALEPSIPSWEEHEQWMRLQLDSFGDYFYIIERVKDTEPVGVVRMDRKDLFSYQISIYVAPEYHHQGIATAALACVDEIHSNAIIFATVLADNTASQQLFRRANYQRVAPDQFIRQSCCMGL